ncbi:MAG: hypothetical protein GF364_05735, partial [Candidatus Lokiarchaeota archaeon]|nr:hypothetical protein [Candidatus Lokiarchaeota archaeon]
MCAFTDGGKGDIGDLKSGSAIFRSKQDILDFISAGIQYQLDNSGNIKYFPNGKPIPNPNFDNAFYGNDIYE